MPSFASIESAYYLLALIVPATVFLYGRIQLTTGRMLKPSESIIHYVTITAIYYAVAWPIIAWASNTPGSALSWWAGWLLLVFAAPLVLGLISGWVAQNDIIYNALRAMGFHPVHIIPTAWEKQFSKCSGEWIVVTLKNGRAFGAVCGERSFISTDPQNRDIFVERTYDIDVLSDCPFRKSRCLSSSIANATKITFFCAAIVSVAPVYFKGPDHYTSRSLAVLRDVVRSEIAERLLLSPV